MSCAVCNKDAKVPDFDGKTYFEIRREKYFGYPAALFVYNGAYNIAGYGINACPYCGEIFKKEI